MPIENKRQSIYYELGDDPDRMSWTNPSVGGLELREQHLVLTAGLDGAAGVLPPVAYHAIERMEIRSLGSRARSVGTIVGILGMTAIAAAASAFRRVEGASLADLGGGGTVVLAAFLLFLLGTFLWVANRKWLCLHLVGDAGTRLVVALSSRKVSPDDLRAAIDRHRRATIGGAQVPDPH